MRASVYRYCLQLVANRDQLNASELYPVMISEVLALERDLNAQLPRPYEEFLTETGVGREFDDLAVWFHLDPSRSGNILQVNEQLRRGAVKPPEEFLAVYDSHDEEIYGFLRDEKQYSNQVYAWSREDGALDLVSDSFGDFLDMISDCSAEEIERAEQMAMNGDPVDSQQLLKLAG